MMNTKRYFIKMFLPFWFTLMIVGANFRCFYISVKAEDRKGVLLALSCKSCHGNPGLSPGANAHFV